MIELAGVRATHGRAVAVEVDRLEVHAGEILVVIGPNGSGKSSLLRVMALLQAPAVGAVRFEGQAVTREVLLGMRRRMASVFQDPLLIDASVFDNVALGLRFRRLRPAEIAPRVQGWLHRLGIAHLAERPARTLSGGEAQRAALARALVLQPALLLLDEPFSALDQPTREALIIELGRILRQDRITTVLVTHDREEAMTLGDRVAALIEGRILQIGEASRVFRAPVSETVARFVGVETIVDGRVVAVEGGLLTLDVGGPRVEVVGEARPGDWVRLCVRPEDVTLSAPEDVVASRSRNRLCGTVKQIAPVGVHVRAVIDCGFPLVALLARRSVEDLALAEGMAAVAAFKAAAAHVIPRS